MYRVAQMLDSELILVFNYLCYCAVCMFVCAQYNWCHMFGILSALTNINYWTVHSVAGIQRAAVTYWHFPLLCSKFRLQIKIG